MSGKAPSCHTAPMATTLRDLLIQRAARLQGRPALTAPGWGTLSYAQFRNRVEGVALGLLAEAPPPAVHSATGTPWDWAAEVAAAASGLRWDPAGQRVSTEVLGGARFNDESGRGPYHAREQVVQPATPFSEVLDHGTVMLRLRRLNGQLGWDHETEARFPMARLADPALRAALWSALYAGAHTVLEADPEPARRFLPWRPPLRSPWDPAPFLAFWTVSQP